MIPSCECPVNQSAVWLRIFHVFYSHLLYNSRKPRYSLIYYSASAALLSGGAHGYPPAALFSGPVRRNELYPRRPAAVFVAPGTAAVHHRAGSRAVQPAVRQRPPQALPHRPGREPAAPCRAGGGAVPANAGIPAGRDPVGAAGAHRHQRGAGAGLPAWAGNAAGQVPPAVPSCGDAVPPAGQRRCGRCRGAGRAGRRSGHRPGLCGPGTGPHHPAGRPCLPAGAPRSPLLGPGEHPAGRPAGAAGAAAQPAAGPVIWCRSSCAPA